MLTVREYINLTSGVIKSAMQLGRQILFKKKPEVILYYPQHFNRSAEGTNPYFAPIVSLCTENSISYIVLEEPAPGFPEDKRSIKADAILWFVLFLRKIYINCLKNSQVKADRKIGKVLDLITFHKLKAKTFITISNSMIDVLGDINSEGKVFDFQHGIIYCGHPGYFNGDVLRDTFLIPNRKVLLWGELYKNSIAKAHGIHEPSKSFEVVGYPMYKEIKINNKKKDKIILISLQFTADLDSEVSSGIMEMLSEFIDEATKKGYKILMKHHPRFNNEVDLKPLIDRYPSQLSVTTQSLELLAEEIKLHITWGSTTAMEYASYGIPTIFLRDNRFDWATDMFYGQYQYPLYDNMSYSEVLHRAEDEKNYRDDCATIKKWYNSAYAPLNKGMLLKILKGEYTNEK